MARAGRIAGAIVAETGANYFLVGNTKVPCDWASLGFEAPAEIDALKRPYIPLVARRPVELGGVCLALALEGEELALVGIDADADGENRRAHDFLTRSMGRAT